MATKKKPAAKKQAKANPELVFEDGKYWVISGTKRLDVGRSRTYAEKFMADHYPK